MCRRRIRRVGIHGLTIDENGNMVDLKPWEDLSQVKEYSVGSSSSFCRKNGKGPKLRNSGIRYKNGYSLHMMEDEGIYRVYYYKDGANGSDARSILFTMDYDKEAVDLMDEEQKFLLELLKTQKFPTTR